MLGAPLENRVLDLDRDGFAAADSALPPARGMLAPGCHGPGGRLPSGVCGLETTGLYGVDVPHACLSCGRDAPPGAHMATRATVVRFLDARADATTLTPFLGLGRVDANHKLADAAARAGVAAQPVVLGPVLWWAWLGDWQEKNANGVIDHLVDGTGHVVEGNEFVWRGGCLRPAGPPNPGPHCVAEPGPPALLGFAFPGDHRGRAGLGYPVQLCGADWLCGSPLGDPPGTEALCHLAGVAVRCGAPGDPLLGPQDSVAPDDAFQDRTGEAIIDWRGWPYGDASAAWYYDQSVLVVRHVFVAAYDAPADPASANRLDLARARFLDVDAHANWNPNAEALLAGTVRPAARGTWLALRGVLP